VWEQRADGRWQQAVVWEQAVVARRGTACVFIDARPRRTLEQWAQAWACGEQLPLDITEEAICDGGYCTV